MDQTHLLITELSLKYIPIVPVCQVFDGVGSWCDRLALLVDCLQRIVWVRFERGSRRWRRGHPFSLDFLELRSWIVLFTFWIVEDRRRWTYLKIIHSIFLSDLKFSELCDQTKFDNYPTIQLYPQLNFCFLKKLIWKAFVKLENVRFAKICFKCEDDEWYCATFVSNLWAALDLKRIFFSFCVSVSMVETKI